jgi:hypothetical protein
MATTFNPVLPVVVPCKADIAAVPAPTPVASPEDVMVATAVLEEVQVTWLVMFWVLLSEYVPVAVNCWGAPAPIVGLAGVTAIEVRFGPPP